MTAQNKRWACKFQWAWPKWWCLIQTWPWKQLGLTIRWSPCVALTLACPNLPACLPLLPEGCDKVTNIKSIKKIRGREFRHLNYRGSINCWQKINFIFVALGSICTNTWIKYCIIYQFGFWLQHLGKGCRSGDMMSFLRSVWWWCFPYISSHFLCWNPSWISNFQGFMIKGHNVLLEEYTIRKRNLAF